MKAGTAGNRKKILKKVLWGAVAGFISYIILIFIRSPWEEILPALLLGSVPGLVDKRTSSILVGSSAAAIGWLAGAFLFGIVLELGLGAWLIAGAFLGLAFGLISHSFLRTVAGFFLGLTAGLFVEASRYISLFSEALRPVDMQLIILMMAGILLPLAAGLASKPARGK